VHRARILAVSYILKQSICSFSGPALLRPASKQWPPCGALPRAWPSLRIPSYAVIVSCLPVQANPRLRANSVASALGNRTRRDPGTAVRTYHEGLKPTRRTGTFYLAGNRNFLFGSDTEDHDCTTSPDGRSNSSSGHRREVLHANPEGLSSSKLLWPQPPFERP
jgi:hypothetical protein